MIIWKMRVRELMSSHRHTKWTIILELCYFNVWDQWTEIYLHLYMQSLEEKKTTNTCEDTTHLSKLEWYKHLTWVHTKHAISSKQISIKTFQKHPSDFRNLHFNEILSFPCNQAHLVLHEANDSCSFTAPTSLVKSISWCLRTCPSSFFNVAGN